MEILTNQEDDCLSSLQRADMHREAIYFLIQLLYLHYYYFLIIYYIFLYSLYIFFYRLKVVI